MCNCVLYKTTEMVAPSALVCCSL